MNLATLLEGPANVTHRGQTLHFRGGLTLTPLAELFSIDSDLYGPLDQRASDNSVVISGTPVGVWTAAQLAVLYRWTNPAIGSLVTPRYDVSSVTPATDVIALVGAAAPRTGCPVRFALFPGATIPAGLSEATLYYWGAAGTLHPTEADALAATNPVDITSAGAGDFALIEQEPVIIDALAANRRITFHNGAITGMPPIIHSAVASMLGAASFGCFRKNNAAWSDANSLYTVAKVALSDTPPDAANIVTQDYSLAFGAAPWDSFKARGPITLTPQLRTEPIITDGLGTLGLRIAGLDVAAMFAPQGFSEEQMLDLLGLQGGTAARGKSKVRGNLVITGTGVHNIVYNAAPRQLPQTFSPTGPRAGELEARGAAGITGARFYVGTAAP
ncbi:MAG: hypothetical protein PHE83_05875 [Opitutaceae bacterium]|nr:hypothetical protein [Opitutaceae bacterium]